MDVLTNTKRQLFRNCRRAYYYRYEQNLVPRVELETLRRGSGFGLAIHGLAQGLDPIEVTEEYYGEMTPSSQEESDQLVFEREVVLILVDAYVERYGLGHRREVEYQRPLVNPDTGRHSRSFVLGGKIDGMAVLGDRRALVIEDKLTQNIQMPRIQSLPLDEQTTEYLDALLWKGWSGEVEYRFTRWPSIKVRQDETLPEFVERFRADVAERPDFYFIKQQLLFPTGHIEEHQRERWQIAKDILECRRTGRWYKSPSMCDPYRGGCRYFPLCTHQPDAMDRYKIGSQNPELELDHA